MLENAKTDVLEVEGTIKEVLPNATYTVGIEDHEITCHVSGKMRMEYVKLEPGDTVTVEISPYDLTRGRITSKG